MLDDSNIGGLTKLGNGTLTLGGSNAYGGTTTVAAGLLRLATRRACPTTPR